MTRKISLIIGIAVAALTVGAPAAFGEGRLAGSPQPTLATPDPMIEDGFAQAVAASLALKSSGVTLDPMIEDGFAQTVATSLALRSSGAYTDAHERAGFQSQFDQQGAVSTQRPDSNLGEYREAGVRAVPTGSVQVSPTSSGNDVEWPQIGIGFGIGIILMLGLWLAMRATRIRPLAH